ncbi:MAG: hypothetical protein ACHQX3_06250, partial [Nitrospirales bacterium]
IGYIIRGLNEWLPKITDFLMETLRKMPGWIAEGVSWLAEAAGKIIGGIKDGLEAALPVIAEWLAGLPERIIEFLGDVTDWLLETGKMVLQGMLDGLESGIESLLNFFSELPGKLWDRLDRGLQNILTEVGTWVGKIVTEVGRLITEIPQGLVALPGALIDAVKGAWNAAVNALPDIPKISLPIVGEIFPGFNWNALRLAMGGIVPGTPLGTLALIGEGGGAEAVIPLTKPKRAAEILAEAGLILPGGGGETTLVRIEEATFVEPTDVQMLLGAVRMAYLRYGGR